MGSVQFHARVSEEVYRRFREFVLKKYGKVYDAFGAEVEKALSNWMEYGGAKVQPAGVAQTTQAAEEAAKPTEAEAATPPPQLKSNIEKTGVEKRGDGGEGDEAEEFLRKVMKYQASRPQYTDEQLLKFIVNEARRDYWCGTGRIFMSEFCKLYNCDEKRLERILKSSKLKWRNPCDNVILIDGI